MEMLITHKLAQINLIGLAPGSLLIEAESAKVSMMVQPMFSDPAHLKILIFERSC